MNKIMTHKIPQYIMKEVIGRKEQSVSIKLPEFIKELLFLMFLIEIYNKLDENLFEVFALFKNNL